MPLKDNIRTAISDLLRPLVWINTQVAGQGVRILMYHKIRQTDSWDQLAVPPKLFSAQMNYLASEGFSVISLDRLLLMMNNAAPFDPKVRYVVITFDDGYQDNYESAFPSLVKYGHPATIFLITKNMETPKRSDTSRAFLSWLEVHEMAKHNIQFGSHTLTHAILSDVPTEHAREEIVDSKKVMDQAFGFETNSFCYPKGALTQTVKELVRDAGYKIAVTVQPGANYPGADLFALRRTEVTARDTLPEFKKKLEGAYDLLHSTWQKSKRIREMWKGTSVPVNRL